MAGIDFCCCCGDWIPASTGKMRAGPDGIEIVCKDCLKAEQRRATISHDANSGTLDD